MAVFPTIRAVKPAIKVLATTSGDSTDSPDDSDVPTPDPDDSPSDDLSSDSSDSPPAPQSSSGTSLASSPDNAPAESSKSKSNRKAKLMKDRANSLVIHDRLFHPGKERLRQLGVKFDPKNCEFCILGKQTHTPFLATISDKTDVPLLRVSSDICGQINPISYGNAKYVLIFLDLATSYSWVYTISDKLSNTVLKCFKQWLAIAERQSGYKLKFFHTDGGKEYTGKTAKNTFTTFLQDCRIVHDSTPAHSSASNGAAERLNRTLFDMARPSLIKAKLPTPFWAEAIIAANKVRNRLPSKSAPTDERSPGTPPRMRSLHEAWFGKPPQLDHLRRFSCVAFHRIPTEVITKGAKADARAVKCCLLGYIGNRIYRLWDPEQ
jgi:hypothetical protein